MTKINKLYPGRPNYTGPTKGLFGLVHHDTLFEPSHDIMERVNVIKNYKPRDEIKTRLHCLVYLPPERLPSNLNEAAEACVEAWKVYCEAQTDCYKARKAHYKARKAYYEAQKACGLLVEELIRELVPNCPWDGKSKRLVFPKK